ncbi:hypothetical protein Tco_1113902 [Tanacetum coccineum]|uniref:Transmembrane protein n=1 Tax=Tanacetum coccineum TaxID=301880 RepID=A0ABQ5ITM0_9ASTR
MDVVSMDIDGVCGDVWSSMAGGFRTGSCGIWSRPVGLFGSYWFVIGLRMMGERDNWSHDCECSVFGLIRMMLLCIGLIKLSLEILGAIDSSS